MENTFQNNFKQIIFFILIIVLSVLLFIPLRIIFAGFLGAATLYIINHNFLNYLNKELKWNIHIVSILLVALNIFIMLIPLSLAVIIVLPKLNTLLNQSGEFLTGIKQIILELETRFNIEILSTSYFEKIPSILSATIPEVLGSISSFALNISTMFFILYFMFVSSKTLGKGIRNLIPLKEENIDIISSETKNIIKSYAIGIPVISTCQGILACIGYWIFDIPDVLFWGFLTAIVAVIPFVGTGLIAVPLIAYLFAIGDINNGIGLSIYVVVLVMNVDNILRLFLLKAFANIHPLVTLCGVIVGLKLFGFLGLIFGPLLVSYFILLIRIYNIEFPSFREKS
jgi:predicted PurR-regulated permease PerM